MWKCCSGWKWTTKNKENAELKKILNRFTIFLSKSSCFPSRKIFWNLKLRKLLILFGLWKIIENCRIRKMGKKYFISSFQTNTITQHKYNHNFNWIMNWWWLQWLSLYSSIQLNDKSFGESMLVFVKYKVYKWKI